MVINLRIFFLKKKAAQLKQRKKIAKLFVNAIQEFDFVYSVEGVGFLSNN